jgi:DNA polymerase-3 subunit beta
MKFIIPTQELNFIVQKILNVVPQKPALPILSIILIDVHGGILTVTGTDLTVGITCRTEVKMIEEGSTTLPSRKLGPLVKELTSTHAQISTNENHITQLVANTSKFKIHGIEGSTYPQLPDLLGATQFKIPQKILKDLLYRVSFAIPREDDRFVLTGALMTLAGGQVTLLATDGKRLARARASIAMAPEFNGSYVIPSKAIDELLKHLKDNGEALVSLLHDKIGVEIDGITLITKLLAGDYPDVSQVIPEKSDIIVTLHKEELTSLLRQVSLFIADHTHSVKLSFSEGDLQISANSSEVGEGKVNMPANYRGPKMDIAFNPSYFLDILRHIKEETFNLGVTDPFNPGVITENEGKFGLEASPLFVLMPMRLSEV